MRPGFVLVHGGVCAAEQGIRVVYGSVVDVGSDCDVDAGGAHDGFDFGEIFCGSFFVHVFADHEKFIAAHAEGVVPVGVVDEDLGGVADEHVSCMVAVGVVGLFEVVNVRGEEGEMSGSVVCGHEVVESSSVESSCQGIASALFFDFYHGIAVADHSG